MQPLSLFFPSHTALLFLEIHKRGGRPQIFIYTYTQGGVRGRERWWWWEHIKFHTDDWTSCLHFSPVFNFLTNQMSLLVLVFLVLISMNSFLRLSAGFENEMHLMLWESQWDFRESQLTASRVEQSHDNNTILMLKSETYKTSYLLSFILTIAYCGIKYQCRYSYYFTYIIVNLMGA